MGLSLLKIRKELLFGFGVEFGMAFVLGVGL
jgi:hypothetical protein